MVLCGEGGDVYILCGKYIYFLEWYFINMGWGGRGGWRGEGEGDV